MIKYRDWREGGRPIAKRVLSTFKMHRSRMLNLDVERETKDVQGK